MDVRRKNLKTKERVWETKRSQKSNRFWHWVKVKRG